MYLRDGRVTILETWPADRHPRDHVDAQVVGRNTTHLVTFGGDWSCTCGKPAECAHVAAVQLVTGFASAAAKRQTGTTAPEEGNR